MYDKQKNPPGENEEEEQEDEEEEEEVEESVMDMITCYLRDAGLIYTIDGDECWVVFLCRTLNADIETEDPSEDGIYIKWKASPPCKLLRSQLL